MVSCAAKEGWRGRGAALRPALFTAVLREAVEHRRYVEKGDGDSGDRGDSGDSTLEPQRFLAAGVALQSPRPLSLLSLSIVRAPADAAAQALRLSASVAEMEHRRLCSEKDGETSTGHWCSALCSPQPRRTLFAGTSAASKRPRRRRGFSRERHRGREKAPQCSDEKRERAREREREVERERRGPRRSPFVTEGGSRESQCPCTL